MTQDETEFVTEVCDPRSIHPRRACDELLHRMDIQDRVLNEIQATLRVHMALEAETKPALDELLSIWKGSRVIIPVLLGFCTLIAAFYSAGSWLKDHIK